MKAKGSGFNAWDGWELVEEYFSSLNVVTGYLQGATGVIKSWSAANTLYYYQDKLGSTTHVANTSGQLLESYRYDLTGTPSYYNSLNTQLSTTNYSVVDLYAGERWIPELRLYDLRNRFMSPELGRFLQADPIGFKGDASNLYRYCGNDPVDRTDPTGLTDVNYVGDITRTDQQLKRYLDDINPPDVISVSAHGDALQLMTSWGGRGERRPVSVAQVAADIRTRVPGKFANKDMRIRLYSCGAGDWRTAGKALCAAQRLANETQHKVDATGAYVNPETKRMWPTDVCNDLNWYQFTPGAEVPTLTAAPPGYLKGRNDYRGLGGDGSKPHIRLTYDSYDSTTPAAANWEASWGNGGWLAANRLGR